MQPELLYGLSNIALTLALFFGMLGCNELGFRLGVFVQAKTDSEVKSLTGSIQASILGLLALLLGFSFSMSMQRYDNRSMVLIEEANAIGTALLRVELLPEQFQDPARDIFREYIDLRVAASQLDLTETEARRNDSAATVELQNRLWSLAIAAAEQDARPVTTGAFLQSLNELIDSRGKRNALLGMHVPEVVLILLFCAFAAAGGILGYSGGLTGKRVLVPMILISLLITMIVFVIIDLDRPRRGLIQVNQGAMLELTEATRR